MRPCAIPGCAELVERGRCPAHARKTERARGRTAERGYDKDHESLRVLCFERDHWRCVDCGWEPDLVRVFREAGRGNPPREQVLSELRARFARGDRHLHADHEIPIRERPELRLVLANYRTRCDRCHNIKTASGN